MHGGALANLLWVPADAQTAVIEICPTAKPSISWWDIATGMRVDYWQVLVPDVSHDQPLEVPLGVLGETLDEVQRAQQRQAMAA